MQACCGQQRLPPTSKHPVLLWSLWFSSGISLGSACHMTSSGLNLDSNLKFAEVVIVQISAYCFAQSCNHSWSLGKNKEWEQICMFASNSVQSSKSKLATCARKGRLLRFQDLLVVKVLSAPKPLNKLHGVWILFKSVENVKLRTAVSWFQPSIGLCFPSTPKQWKSDVHLRVETLSAWDCHGRKVFKKINQDFH